MPVQQRGLSASCLHMVGSEMLMASKDCSDSTQMVSPLMLGPAYVSYGASASGNCGGAHGFGGESTFVLDLATGAPVDWLKLVKGEGVSSDPASTTDKLSSVD